MNATTNVLLIEDDQDDADIIKEICSEELVNRGYKITHVKTLEEGFSYLSTNKVSAILLDLMLPDSTGDSLSDVIKKTKNIPIIILTGLDDQKIGIESLKNGAQDYLVKGKFDGHTLIRSILYAIERKKLETKSRRKQYEKVKIETSVIKRPKTMKILLIEDDKDDADIIKEICLGEFSKKGYTIDHVHTLKEAEDYLRKIKVAIILLNLMLPDSDQHNTLDQILHVTRDTPIVILSRLEDETLAISSLGKGAQYYLIKGKFTSYTLTKTMIYAIEKQKIAQ